MATRETGQTPYEPSGPSETGGGVGPSPDGAAPPRPSRTFSPTRVVAEAVRGARSRIVSPDRRASWHGGASRVRSMNGGSTEYATSAEAVKGREYPPDPPGVTVLREEAAGSEAGGAAGTSDGSNGKEYSGDQREARDGAEKTRETGEKRELDPVRDAEYIKGEKARAVAAKVIADNQLGENPDPLTLSQYGEAVAPEITNIQDHFKGKMTDREGNVSPEKEAKVLETVKGLVGDASKLGLLDDQLNGTTEVTTENMGEALVRAASADPEGFKQRMEAMDLKGADSFVAQSALDTGTADGLYSLHEEYLMSIGDEEGAARSMNERMGAERMDMSDEAVAERAEQRRMAEEDSQRIADEARELTEKILQNTGKDKDAGKAGHEDKVDIEGVKVAESIDKLEHKLLEHGVVERSDSGELVYLVDIDPANRKVPDAVYQLVGSEYFDFGNGPELITPDNMAKAVMLAATNDREGFTGRATDVQDTTTQDIANTALGATSGEDMTSYTDDIGKQIQNYGATKDIKNGAVDGTIEQVVVETLSGKKVIEVAVKSTDVPEGESAEGWDSESQKAAYTKVFGEPAFEPMPEQEGTAVAGTSDIPEGGIGGGQVKGNVDSQGFGSGENPDAAPTFVDATNPDAAPTYGDSEQGGTSNPSGEGVRPVDDGETYTPSGQDRGGEAIDGGSYTEGPSGMDSPTGSETTYVTSSDGSVTIMQNTDTGATTITMNGNTYASPYVDGRQSEDTQQESMTNGATSEAGSATGEAVHTSDSPFTFEGTAVEGGFGADGVNGAATGEASLAPAGDVFAGMGSNSGQTAAEALRADEGDFLASTTAGEAGSGHVVVDGQVVGTGAAEASASEKGDDAEGGGSDGNGQGGSDDDSVSADAA